MNASSIRVKAIAIIRRGHDVLLSFAIDPATGSRYGRFLGGGVEPGERASEALRRELREEIGVDLTGVSLLRVLENIYEYDGRIHHEVIFAFAAGLADPNLYSRQSFAVNESVCDGPAEWVSIAVLRRGEIAIYPPELIGLLEQLPAPPTL